MSRVSPVKSAKPSKVKSFLAKHQLGVGYFELTVAQCFVGVNVISDQPLQSPRKEPFLQGSLIKKEMI
jgi:hypothetical protein